MVEFSLVRASTGPEEIASRMPYISIFPPKLCSIHLMHIKVDQVVHIFTIKLKSHYRKKKKKKDSNERLIIEMS